MRLVVLFKVITHDLILTVFPLIKTFSEFHWGIIFSACDMSIY